MAKLRRVSIDTRVIIHHVGGCSATSGEQYMGWFHAWATCEKEYYSFPEEPFTYKTHGFKGLIEDDLGKMHVVASDFITFTDTVVNHICKCNQ